jgi:hypothetical protein
MAKKTAIAPARALKVFRTAIGFHDAYVAASSQKAALSAWGAGTNLFAAGLAEVVDDPKVTAAPLADPGKVIKVSRGSLAQHLAADKKAAKRKPAKSADGTTPVAKAKPKPAPRPSRKRLDDARAELNAFDRDARQAVDELRRREEAIREGRLELERQQSALRRKLTARHDDAEAAFEEAMARWRAAE